MPPPESEINSTTPVEEGVDAYGYLRVRLLIPNDLPSAGVDYGNIEVLIRDASVHGYEPDPDVAEGFSAYIVTRRRDVEPSATLRDLIDRFGPLTGRPIVGFGDVPVSAQIRMRFEMDSLDERINMRASIAALRSDPTVSHVDISDRNAGLVSVHIRPGIEPSVDVQRMVSRHPILLSDLDPPTSDPNPPPIRRLPEDIIREYLATSPGRTALARSMVAPLRNRVDYQSIGRSVFLVEQLPDGALPSYEPTSPVPEIVPLPPWCELNVWVYDPVTYTKGQVVAITADHVQISVWNSTLMEGRPREEVSRYELLPGEPQPRTVYERLLDDYL